jgi:hypothetical protein
MDDRWMEQMLHMAITMRTVSHAIRAGMIKWLLESAENGIVAVTASTANGNID